MQRLAHHGPLLTKGASIILFLKGGMNKLYSKNNFKGEK